MLLSSLILSFGMVSLKLLPVFWRDKLFQSLQKHPLLPAAMALFYFDFLFSTPRVRPLRFSSAPCNYFHSLLRTPACLLLFSSPVITVRVCLLSCTTCSSLCRALTYRKECDRIWSPSSRIFLSVSL